MTLDRARAIARGRLKFGDPEHIEAVELLALYAEAERAGVRVSADREITTETLAQSLEAAVLYYGPD